jgi:hypothetical protein
MLFTERSLSVISGFRRDVNQNCALLGYFATSSDNALNWRFGTTYRSHLGFLTLADGTYRLSQYVGKELPLYAP